jgi:hypothetical protein
MATKGGGDGGGHGSGGERAQAAAQATATRRGGGGLGCLLVPRPGAPAGGAQQCTQERATLPDAPPCVITPIDPILSDRHFRQ